MFISDWPKEKIEQARDRSGMAAMVDIDSFLSALDEIERCHSEINRLSNAEKFPIQGEPGYLGNPEKLGPTFVPWFIAEYAYKNYSKRYGTGQTLRTLANRGGFGQIELLWLLLDRIPGERGAK